MEAAEFVVLIHCRVIKEMLWGYVTTQVCEYVCVCVCVKEKEKEKERDAAYLL